MRLAGSLAQHLAAVRALLVLTVLTGVLYPLGVTALAQLPGLQDKANGSLITVRGSAVGSSLIGQSFADASGRPLVQYLQGRPSAAGAAGYDPLATGASNLGPESVVDVPPDPTVPGDTGHLSLLTQVCARSRAVGSLEGVYGARPYCTPDGVGAVLGVFRAGGLVGPLTRVVSLDQPCPATPFVAEYQGVRVECATRGEDYSRGVVTPIRGTAPDPPAVPPDAVTAGGSGLDPGISPDYARLQAPRVAAARGVSPAAVLALVQAHTTPRLLGFLGEPTVDVLGLNLDLDRRYPYGG